MHHSFCIRDSASFTLSTSSGCSQLKQRFFLRALCLHMRVTRILHLEEQNLMSQNQFLGSKQGQISPSVPNKITSADIPSSTISQKAFENDHNLPPLLRRLLRADYITPSVPNSGIYIPASTASHSASPLLGSLQKSPRQPPFMPKLGSSIPQPGFFGLQKYALNVFSPINEGLG